MDNFDAKTDGSDKKRRLFVMQRQTLDTFLNNGAINLEQYMFSLRGLVAKMDISENELASWEEYGVISRLFPR